MTALPTAVPDFRTLGLAAGLAVVLDGIDPAAVAPGGAALLPSSLVPAAAEAVPHPFAALEDLVMVRFPRPGGGPGLTGRRAALLESVRVGVLSRLLDAAVDRLKDRSFGGVPLIEHQLVSAAIADTVTEIELASCGDPTEDPVGSLREGPTEGPPGGPPGRPIKGPPGCQTEGPTGSPTGSPVGSVPGRPIEGSPDASSVSVRWAWHERLTEAGWAVTRLFGAEGYLIDHPVRALHLSALAADLWLARPGPVEGVG